MSAVEGGPRPRVVAAGRALAWSCHPLPTLAVTVLSAGLALLAGLTGPRIGLVTLAVLAGQLSIGWGNDALDAARDRMAGRADKPVAVGVVATRTVAVAAAVAGATAVVLAALLGPPGAAAALTVVACGWAYNAGAKGTAVSWLPYLIAFGTLPAIATLSAVPPRLPAAWATAAGGLMGVSAHLANVLPDLRTDAATGIRGLPHRLGAKGTALGGVAALLAASVVILLGPPGAPRAWQWAGLGGAVVLGGTAAVTAWRDPSSRRYFPAVLAVALLDVALFAGSGVRL